MVGSDALIAHAAAAREHAVASYSGFRVGAALESDDGRVFTGCNVENASFGLTICAERVALFKALSEGVRRFRQLAVVADTDTLTPPCGACRQLIWEFAGDIPVVLANLSGQTMTHLASTLLPHPFDGALVPPGKQGPTG